MKLFIKSAFIFLLSGLVLGLLSLSPEEPASGFNLEEESSSIEITEVVKFSPVQKEEPKQERTPVINVAALPAQEESPKQETIPVVVISVEDRSDNENIDVEEKSQEPIPEVRQTEPASEPAPEPVPEPTPKPEPAPEPAPEKVTEVPVEEKTTQETESDSPAELQESNDKYECGIATKESVAPKNLDILKLKVEESFYDPSFGCEITKLTDAEGEGVNLVSHRYSSINAFNKDNNLVLLEKSGGILQIRNLKGEIIKDNLHRFGILPLGFPVWSRTNSNQIYFHPAGGNEIRAFDLSNDVVTTIHTFSQFQKIEFGKGEGDISWDGKHLPILADGKIVLLFNLESKEITKSREMSEASFIDVVDATSQNNLVVMWSEDSKDEVSVIKENLTSLIDYQGHSDRALDSSGNDFIVITNSDDSSPISNCQNGIVRANAQNGEEKCLISLDWSLVVHISCNAKNKDWCLISTYAPSLAEGEWSAFTNEIFLVSLKTGDYIRLAHSRSSNKNYESTPKASLSGDGKYALFASDLEGEINTYLIRLPILP